MPDQTKIAIRLGKRHREILLEERLFIYQSLCKIIRETPLRQPVELSRSDWDHIQGCIAGEANHTEDKQWERKLDRVFRRIEEGCYFSGRWGF